MDPQPWSAPPLARDVTARSYNQDRPALVLLAGMLGDARVWDAIALALNDIVKPWPVRIDLDDSIVELASSVLAQAPPRFWLAGHSLGGIVALEVQRQAPERVSGLALFNSSARGPSAAQLQAWATLAERVQAGEFARIADELARSTLPPSAPAELVRANRAMADAVGPDGLLRQLAAQRSRPDSRPRLPELSTNVLVFGGELDQTCPLELQRELVEGCPRAELVEVPGVGHMLPLEAADHVVARLRRWLQ